MEAFTKTWRSFQDTFPIFGSLFVNIIAALIILFAGLTIARIVRKRLRKSTFGGSQIDKTLRPVTASCIFYLIIGMTLYAFLRKLGVDAASLLAVFGAAGLAIALALRDTLASIASGIMLLFLRPLKVGEYVEAPGYSGTVIEIGLFATQLKNSEGIYLYVPNSTVWDARLTNFGRHTERKLTVDIGVEFKTDLKAAQDILLAVMNTHPAVQQTPSAPECFVLSFTDNAIPLSSRCWLPAQDWMANSSDIRIALKAALDANKIGIPYPQRVITNN